ncbi:hypothetical protein B0J11DRAFT_330761 [Dendryphion nanum]|uniref:Uncharacterized protein n=1 Tax=Dendryphion nanum TaxID=256645 RepID=A0A9P9DNX0_9PLEO|nr:hypothetical protein B0J11DRAFT_330761 [Dendryphion nanum]
MDGKEWEEKGEIESRAVGARGGRCGCGYGYIVSCIVTCLSVCVSPISDIDSVKKPTHSLLAFFLGLLTSVCHVRIFM